jgi:hypothetical protein
MGLCSFFVLMKKESKKSRKKLSTRSLQIVPRSRQAASQQHHKPRAMDLVCICKFTPTHTSISFTAHAQHA